jgi:hypothetical protein
VCRTDIVWRLICFGRPAVSLDLNPWVLLFWQHTAAEDVVLDVACCTAPAALTPPFVAAASLHAFLTAAVMPL